MTTSIPVIVAVTYATSGSCFITIHLLFLRILQKDGNVLQIYVLHSKNLILSHVELHVQKKFIKDNNMSLGSVSFAFIGKMIKAVEYFVRDSLHKHYSMCKPPFLSQKSRIGVKFLNNEETL